MIDLEMIDIYRQTNRDIDRDDRQKYDSYRDDRYRYDR